MSGSGWHSKLSAGNVLKVLLFFCIIAFFFDVAPADEKKAVRIGVLAYKGRDEASKMWTATAEYLHAALPESEFKIIPLGFDEIERAVRNNDIDFLIANSSIYVEMEAKYGVTRISTMKNRGYKGSLTQFGGTIFCRADRRDIRELKDLKGKSFVAVDETSLGGWHAAWGEFKTGGINPYRDFGGLTFTGNHETVVFAVREGKADAGTVRTDTLERMAEQKRISLNDFRVLDPKQYADFQFLVSTRLYPEWPIARLRDTPEDLAKNVEIALLKMPEESRAARDARISGWTIPLDYHVVHELLKELRLPPYMDYGKTSLSQAARQYWYVPLLAVMVILSLAAVILHILKLNRMILSSKLAADNARNGLEHKVEERTADLRELNTRLESEIDIRRESEQRLLNAEQESREQMLFLQTVIDSVSDPVMVIAPDYKVKLSNRAARGISGEDTYCYRISHNQDSPCREDECPCPLQEVLKTRDSVTMVHNHVNRTNGSVSVVEINASPVFDSSGEVAYVIEICRDITEKVRNDEQKKKDGERLFQQQKEESISTLAGGIAHDFNNILMGVLGNAELLRLRLPLSPEEARPVDNIISSVDRMADLTRQLLAYARGGKYQHTLLSMSDIVKEAMNLSHKGTALKIKTRVDLSDDVWQVIGDRSQLVQAIVNLFNNAFETMENSGGTLAVTAENIEGRPAWTCRLLHEHPAGDYVSVTISDTGSGIPESISGKIFEPFFSTKFLGRGLGLSAALGIIMNHNGCITFESRSGSGTTFQLLLPRAAGTLLTQGLRTAPEPGAETGRTVLIVDDEEHIVQLLHDALQSFGYSVHTADSGEKAVDFFRSRQKEISAVILDLQMPGMSGKEAFVEMKKIEPEVKIIISTGYDRAIAMEEMRPFVPEGFIQKPYRITALQKTLQSLLEAKP